ncbi:DUF2892 domain-containing protein [Danxiaibacter flavus]|uniref:DUF2892 domain-containing protein n=1 Tax=Danxiaibacter flavus TaxID=3049108 RepID=A0ABV3ZHY5_9BACT|nr:DUF2892 domain-containing protein [Chitinophagaceae bacterium DXS]
MKTNVGSTDRSIRFTIAAALATYYLQFLNNTAGTIALVTGIIMLFTVYFRFCPLYSLLHISTRKPAIDFKKILQQNAIIVDVRQPNEYNLGHIEGSINMPLSELSEQITTLKGKTVVVCCASGARSAVAKKILSAKGIKTFNGGGWKNLEGDIK